MESTWFCPALTCPSKCLQLNLFEQFYFLLHCIILTCTYRRSANVAGLQSNLPSLSLRYVAMFNHIFVLNSEFRFVKEIILDAKNLLIFILYLYACRRQHCSDDYVHYHSHYNQFDRPLTHCNFFVVMLTFFSFAILALVLILAFRPFLRLLILTLLKPFLLTIVMPCH